MYGGEFNKFDSYFDDENDGKSDQKDSFDNSDCNFSSLIVKQDVPLFPRVVPF